MRRLITQVGRETSARYVLRDLATILVLVAQATCLPALAGAQVGVAGLESGARVRVSASSLGSSPRIGRVVTATQDSLVLHTTVDGRPVTRSIARDQITRIDVSVGQRQGRKGQFAGIGFLVGAGIAQLIPREQSEGATSFLDEDDLNELGDALLLGGLGAGVGAYLGRAREDWRRVSLGATQLSLRAPRAGRGVAVGATIAF